MRDMFRVVAIALGLLITGCAANHPPETASAPASVLDLQAIVQRARAESGVPGLAAAFVRSEGAATVATAGVRDVTSGAAVETNDVFEIGSITKSVTGTAIASLVEKGELKWNTTIADVFGATKEHEAYAGVSVSQVLRHRAGIRRLQSPDPEMEQTLDGLKGTAAEQRATVVQWILTRPPDFPPGTSFAYSNGGYIVAGAMAERVARADFATVLKREVFDPLAMGTATLESDRKHDGPRGHTGTGESAHAAPATDNPYELPPAFEPAGAARMSVGDLATYGRAHLRGLRGIDGRLRASTIAELHRSEPGPERAGQLFGAPTGYAAGWVTYELPNGHRVSWHNGSAGSFFAWLTILPDDDLAVAVLTNTGAGQAACEQATAAILEGLGVER